MAEKKPNIVIVDPSKAMRALLNDVMQDMDVELTLFDDGPSSLVYLENNTPKLVIISTKLPGKGGLALLQQMRGLNGHGETPVIMISSKNYAQDQTIANQYRATFLVMPAPMREIRDAVENSLA